VRVYGECSAALYDLARATFNRVRARIDKLPDSQRDPLRQEFYRSNALARTAIGQVTILTSDDSLRLTLERAREAFGDLNAASDRDDLKRRHKEAHTVLTSALQSAREELRHNHRTRWFGGSNQV